MTSHQADMIRFSPVGGGIYLPTILTIYRYLTFGSLGHSSLGCIQEDVFFLFPPFPPFFLSFFVRGFLGPVKVFKLLAFPVES